MDGIFVEDKTFNYERVAQINSITTIVLDVHLMVENAHKKIKKYINAGSNILTVHFEAFKSEKLLIKTLNKIQKAGLIAGLSIKPKTKIEEVKHLLKYVDLVLIMSVEPGKSGQKFKKASLDKIKLLKEEIKNQKLFILIEVDGGVNLDNNKDIIEAGADIVVVGNFLFKALDKKQTIEKIKVG